MLSFHIGIEDLLRMGIHPLVVIMILPVTIFVSLLCVRIYYSRLKYRCTECGKIFQPKFSHAHIGIHDSAGRDQYCPHCRKITYCKYAKDK